MTSPIRVVLVDDQALFRAGIRMVLDSQPDLEVVGEALDAGCDVGDVDPRLPVQQPILGVLTEDGTPIAFHVEAAASVLSEGESLVIEGIEVRLDAGGLRALANGEDAGGHQAFWFAWSQFYPETKVWPLDFQ